MRSSRAVAALLLLVAALGAGWGTSPAVGSASLPTTPTTQARAAYPTTTTCRRNAAKHVTAMTFTRPKVSMEKRWIKRGMPFQYVTLYLVLQGRDARSGVWSVVKDHGVTSTAVHRSGRTRLKGKGFTGLPTSGYSAFRIHALIAWRNPHYATDKHTAYNSAICANPAQPPAPIPKPPADAALGALGWGIAGGSFENSLAWSVTGDGIAQRRTDIVHDGSASMEVSSTAGSGTAYLDTAHSWSGGQLTATVWMRALTGTATGSLALWGMGGSNEGNSTPYAVGTSWTPVQVVTDFSAAHTNLRVQIYPSAGAAGDVLVDTASLSATWVTDGSFESGNTWSYSHGNGGGTTNIVRYTGQSDAHDGSALLATNTTEGGYVYDDIATAPAVGSSTTVTAWVRSQGSSTATGSVCVVATGSSNAESSCTPYAAGSTWTEVQASLVVARSHTGTELQVRPSTGTSLIDTVSALSWATFDGGLESGSRWTASGGATVTATRSAPDHDGSIHLVVGGTTGMASRTVAAGVGTTVDVALQAWLRAPSGTSSGKLCLVATGQTADESNCTPYTVGTRYVPVAVVLDSRSAHDHLTAEIRPTKGTTLADTFSSVG